MKNFNAKLVFWLGSAALMSAIATLLLWWSPAMASNVAESKSTVAPGAMQWGLLAAALSTAAAFTPEPPDNVPETARDVAAAVTLIATLRALVPPVNVPPVKVRFPAAAVLKA